MPRPTSPTHRGCPLARPGRARPRVAGAASRAQPSSTRPPPCPHPAAATSVEPAPGLSSSTSHPSRSSPAYLIRILTLVGVGFRRLHREHTGVCVRPRPHGGRARRLRQPRPRPARGPHSAVAVGGSSTIAGGHVRPRPSSVPALLPSLFTTTAKLLHAPCSLPHLPATQARGGRRKVWVPFSVDLRETILAGRSGNTFSLFYSLSLSYVGTLSAVLTPRCGCPYCCRCSLPLDFFFPFAWPEIRISGGARAWYLFF